jgi:aryl sulfotransferase
MSELVRYKSPIFDSTRWDGFVRRPDDIIISTPPKCGTTWMQMICALLIFQTPELPQPLGLLSPWIDMQTRPLDAIIVDLAAQQHRRFIKTHTPLDGLEYDERVTYICVGRDPRDVFLSWDNHVENTDPIALFTARHNAMGLDDIMDRLAEGPPVRAETEIERFWEWVDDERPITEYMSLAQTLHHLQSFWDARVRPNIVMVHYDDLAADLEGGMRRLAARLRLDVPEDRWAELVAAARFEHMRAHADVIAPETTSMIWNDNQRFFNKGSSGQWRRLLDDAGVARYMSRCRALAPPDLLAWVHHNGLDALLR